MSRLIQCALAVALLACATKPQVPEPVAAVTDARPSLVRMADSTNRLVETAATVSDTANVHARVALQERTADRAHARIRNARTAADNATRLVDAAIVQGDYISAALPAASDARSQSASYTRYWLMGREKLALARTHSRSAMDAADQALGCTAPECTTTHAREVQGYIEQAAGASREAESLVRIAMVYVGQAMSYVR